MPRICAIAASAALFCCVGCNRFSGFLNPAAESFLSLHGKIANAQEGAICSLKLFTEKGKPSRQMTIAPEFKRSLVIAPGVHKYYMEISCTGQPGKFRSETYELGGNQTIDLGTIVLKDR